MTGEVVHDKLLLTWQSNQKALPTQVKPFLMCLLCNSTEEFWFIPKSDKKVKGGKDEKENRKKMKKVLTNGGGRSIICNVVAAAAAGEVKKTIKGLEPRGREKLF